jgi:hypothetical protein
MLVSRRTPRVSRVDAEASGCLVAPPVFKTGERCTAALAGSIPVRLRDLLSMADGPVSSLPAAPTTGCSFRSPKYLDRWLRLDHRSEA